MKAPDFSYVRPRSLEDALALLADPGKDAAALAGGQSLVPMLNMRIAQPELVVDLNAIPDLSYVREDGERIVMGAMTRTAALIADPLIPVHVPLFARALPHVAHTAIRNRGTIGGSVALADPAAEMPALLLALDGTIEVTGAAGSRTIAADDFFLGVYETALGEGELVTAVSVPKAAGRRFAFHELARRHGDYAMAGVAVALGDAPRVAFFSVAEKAVRSAGAEAALAGREPDDAAAVDAALAALADLDCNGDLNAAPDTKRHLAGVVLRRALKDPF